jgi:hypothetical protein
MPERAEVIRIRIAASISVTRCERGPPVRVIGWASGIVMSTLVRFGMGRDCNGPGTARDLAETGMTIKDGGRWDAPKTGPKGPLAAAALRASLGRSS